MKQFVASYAPNNKINLKSTSLFHRVRIVAGVHFIDYTSLWSRMFDRLGFLIDGNLLDISITKDKKKMQKKVRAQTKEGKKVYSTLKCENLAVGHKAQMDNL